LPEDLVYIALIEFCKSCKPVMYRSNFMLW
jgi:hypothetical protein